MPQLHNYRDHIDTIPITNYKTPTLWSHQKAMLEWALSRDKTFLYAGMSTGKTLFGLEYLTQFDGLKLVLCPKSAMSVWQIDYDEFGFQQYTDMILLSEGTSNDKQQQLDAIPHDKNCIVVVNYATAYRLKLSHTPFTAAIADESHRLSQHNSKWSMHLAIECADIPHKVAMTGTPFHDGYEKLYGQMRWLDPLLPGVDLHPSAHPQAKLFGHYKNGFISNFCKVYMRGYTPIINGYKNIDTLVNVLQPYILVVQTEDVHKNLPALVQRKYTYELESDTRQVYDGIQKDGAVLFDDNDGILVPHALTRALRLQQFITNGLLVGDDKTEKVFSVDNRLSVVSDIVENLDDKPVVIFTKFKRDIKHLQALYPDAHLLTGDTDNHADWKAGRGRILLVNISAGATGTRLQRSHHAVFYAIDWSLADFQQAISRLRRNNQKSDTVYLHFVVASGTIDSEIYERLYAKDKLKGELDGRL